MAASDEKQNDQRQRAALVGLAGSRRRAWRSERRRTGRGARRRRGSASAWGSGSVLAWGSGLGVGVGAGAALGAGSASVPRSAWPSPSAVGVAVGPARRRSVGRGVLGRSSVAAAVGASVGRRLGRRLGRSLGGRRSRRRRSATGRDARQTGRDRRQARQTRRDGRQARQAAFAGGDREGEHGDRSAGLRSTAQTRSVSSPDATPGGRR